MQPFKRPLFICSAIEQCRETTNCCAHKQPHIKDERCVPKECRYAPGAADIDCVAYPLEKPNELAPVAPAEIIEQVKEEIAAIPGIELAGEIKVQSVPAQEQDIKEAVKKAQKKGGRKKA